MPACFRVFLFVLFLKSTAQEQERNSIGVRKKCAARIHGIVCKKGSPTGAFSCLLPLIRVNALY